MEYLMLEFEENVFVLFFNTSVNLVHSYSYAHWYLACACIYREMLAPLL